MSIISFYPNTFSKEFTSTSPEKIINAIAIEGTWKSAVEYLRSLNDKEYKAEKKNLPCVTWSGAFKPGTRLIETIERYSGLVVIDIDGLNEQLIITLKSQLVLDQFVYFCFVSPSGKGIKIIVKVNSLAENHRAAFLHLQHYFENTYFVKVDPSGKDICRLCYVSCDPQAIINIQSQVFEVDLKYGEIITEYKQTAEGAKAIHESSKIYAVCVKWIDRNKTYRDGEKNVYIHALACALNRCGVSLEDCIRLIDENLPTPDRIWVSSVKGAYFRGQAEHNSFQVKDIGAQDFIAPAYIANYTDDVAANDLMRITATLYSYKVPINEILDTVSKIGNYYNDKGYIDLRRSNLREMMNNAVRVLQTNIANNAAKNSLQYVAAEDMAMSILDTMGVEGAISTGLPILDEEMFGGMVKGNFYAVVGMGESFKSVLAQYICFVNAVKGVVSLYINSEMSANQYYERLIFMVFGIDLRKEIESGRLSKSTAASFIKQVQEITKGNIFVVNSSGHDKTSVLSTIDHIKATTGKTVQILISDGLSQWSWNGQQEVMATINNSFVGKEVAKEANGGEGVAHIALVHVSGEIKRYTRNTGDFIRGGKKVLANFDAYFCTSRLIHPDTNEMVNEDDVKYIDGKFYVRYVDKRSRTGTVNLIVNVGGSLKLEVEECNPNMYELRINKKQ